MSVCAVLHITHESIEHDGSEGYGARQSGGGFPIVAVRKRAASNAA